MTVYPPLPQKKQIKKTQQKTKPTKNILLADDAMFDIVSYIHWMMFDIL